MLPALFMSGLPAFYIPDQMSSVQFSMMSGNLIFLKCLRLFVTSMALAAMAWAAMRVSVSPMGVPADRN